MKNITSKVLSLSLIIILCCSIKLIAQTVDANYVDGAIYVKIYNHQNETLPLISDANAMPELGTYESAVNTFGIHKIYKSFDYVVSESALQKIYRVEFADIAGVENLINYFESFEFVEVAEKISLNKTMCNTFIEDPIFGYTSYANPNLPTYVPTATNGINRYHVDVINGCFAFQRPSVAIGIVDNGFQTGHPEFVSQLGVSYDVSDQDGNVQGPAGFDHGTAMAGIIGAKKGTMSSPGIGSAGIACNGSMLFAKATNDAAPVDKISHGYEGIAWCIQNGAQVINCSWGSYGFPGVVESLILDLAENNGVVIVAPAGNINTVNSIGDRVYPAGYPTVLSVAATRHDVNPTSSGKILSSITNYNLAIAPWIDVSAPGGSIYTTTGTNGFTSTTGTSAASSVVAAVAGVVYAELQAPVVNAYTAQTVRNCIINAAVDINSLNPSATYDAPPLIDAYSAAQCASTITNTTNYVDWNLGGGNPYGGCLGSTLNFLDNSTLSSSATYSWFFQGATTATSTSTVQNPTGVTYNTPGNYDVSLVVTNSSGTFTKYSPKAISIVDLQTDLVTIDNGTSSQPALSTYCEGSEVQLKLTPLGGYPPYTVQYQIPGQLAQSVTFNNDVYPLFFEATPNGIDILQIEANDFNGNPIQCVLNQNVAITVVSCCENEIVNGNFEQGFNGFTSEYCNKPNQFGSGHFTVSDLVLPTINNTNWPTVREFLPNKNNSLYVQSGSFVGAFVPNSCPNGRFQLPLGPPPNNLCGDPFFRKVIWEQTKSLDNNSTYRFSFLASKNVDYFGFPSTLGYSVAVHPQFELEIVDNITNSIVYTSNTFTLGGFNLGASPNHWFQNLAGIPAGTLPSTGQYKLRILQVFYICNIRYLVDDIVLQKEGQDFTLSASAGCINTAGNVTITATPASLAYTFAGPGVVSTAGNTAVVNVSGNYTVTTTSANVCVNSKDIFIGDCANCPQAPASATWFGSPTVSTDIPTGNLPSGAVVIDGTLTVDQALAISNNPDIFFTANSIANVNANTSLFINQSELKGCADLWNGIVASNNNANVQISNSEIRNMLSGIRVSGGASIDAQNNDFHDNNIGIQLSDLVTPANSIIDNNDFKMVSTNLLPPNQLKTYGYYAVGITNCQDFSLTGNRVEKFHTGIHIYQDNAALGVSTHNTTGNTFKDIKNSGRPPQALPYNAPYVYQPLSGAALSIKNNTPHNSLLIHTGNTLPGNVLDFEDCSTGIYAANVAVDITTNNMANNMHTCIDISRAASHEITVTNNQLNDTYLGVLLHGNPKVGLISQNTITLLPALGLTASPVAYTYPNNVPAVSYGISLSGFSNNNVTNFDILSNTISTQDNEAAIGINLRNAREGNCDANTIQFNSTTSYTGSYPLPSLKGINLSNTNHIHMSDNNVKAAGSSNTPTVPDNPSAGIYMWRSERPHMDCNIFDYTQYGMYVVGRNPVPSHNINNNRFASLKAGILFRHLVTEGTVGDIGAIGSDRDNKFTLVGGTASNPASYWKGKIYRIPGICAGASVPNDAIYTQQSTLDGSSDPYASRISDPTVPQCIFGVQNPSFAPNEIAPGCNLGPNPMIVAGHDGVIDPDYAEDVADEDIIYAEYQEGGEEMDAHDLYAQLEHDPDIRINRPVLNSFYLSYQQEAMANLYEVDMMIAQLTDANMDRASAAFATLLASTVTFNNQIITDEVFESNERLINSYYLDMLAPDWTAFNSEQVDQILLMAADCPYLGGFGVNKARTLAAAYLPHAHYDDLWICNNMGVYKGAGKSRFDIENEGLNSPTKVVERHSGYNVYPNPTHGILNIEYEGSTEATDATFTLYDMLGKQVFEHKLIGAYNGLSLPPLSSGLYTYTIHTENATEKQGKLLLEN